MSMSPPAPKSSFARSPGRRPRRGTGSSTPPASSQPKAATKPSPCAGSPPTRASPLRPRTSYFTSKDHVLVDVLIELAGETSAGLEAKPSRGRTSVDRTVTTLRRAVAQVDDTPNLYIALTRAYIAGTPDVAHARNTLEASMRGWIDLALGDRDVGNRDVIIRILENVLFANMVSLVTGAARAARNRRRTRARGADRAEGAMT